MAGGNDRSVKALKEVWRRAENSLCADCGKPGESLRAAGGRVGSGEPGLSDCTGAWGREGGEATARPGCSLPLPGGELAREEEGDAAAALVGRRTGTQSCQTSRGCVAAALWVAVMSDLKCKSRSCPVRT